MASGGRRVVRRSQRELLGNCVIFGLTLVTCIGFLVFLSHISSFVLHPVVQPTSILREGRLNMRVVDVTQLPSPVSRTRNENDHFNFDGTADDDIQLILGGKENSRSSNTAVIEGDEQLLQDGSKEAQEPLVSRIAFGSCTAKRPIDQPIWREGVIRSDPHAWIWGGDLAYMDWPDVNCKETPNHHQCNCTRNWLHSNRQTCLSGDITHAKKKLDMQMQNPDYIEFLKYMCPTARSSSGWGDLSRCKMPVIGTWDDHDYNWQDGDRRLPTKEQQKHVFLDAFGVPNDSPRRTPGRGIYWKHTLNKGFAGKEIDVLLLDERFHRDNKPCEARREVCEKAILLDPRKYKHDWCKDFLYGGEDGNGSCCRKDEQIWRGWCKVQSNSGDNLWDAACNPKSHGYGSNDLAIDIRSGRPVRKSDSNSAEYDDGIVCEVLGQRQRQWLQDELYKSNAPLKLVVSGSPSFNNPGEFICARRTRKIPEVNCSCYDDYDCYRPAQINFLHTLANAPGCVVVLTGDFHFSDIKVLRPGHQIYSDAYDSFDLPRPIFQIMASGLTTETGQKADCDGYRVDKIGMRPDGECSFVSGPAFGMVEIDWDSPEKVAKLQVRDDQGLVRLETKLSLKTCTEL